MITGALFFAPHVTFAASLFLSPASGVHDVGTTFSVVVSVGSPSQDMNATSGVISFPVDALEVVSISRTNSIISFWVQEPTFSNTQGSISFEGVALDQSFRGSNGRIFSVVFRAKQAGTAGVSFSSGSVLASDGLGTNILQTLSPGSYALAVPKPPVEPPRREEPIVEEPLVETPEEIPEETPPLVEEIVIPEEPAISEYFIERAPWYRLEVPVSVGLLTIILLILLISITLNVVFGSHYTARTIHHVRKRRVRTPKKDI